MSVVPAPLSLQAVVNDLNGAAERIWLDCHLQHPDLNLEVHTSIPSTNTALMQQGRRGHTATTLMVAAEQTAGRGREDRPWQACPGHTLTFSLGMLAELAHVPGGASAMSLAVGLSVAQSLEAHWTRGSAHAPMQVQLKWPNDLWLHGKKLGGILIETLTPPNARKGERWIVVGLGLNLHPMANLPDSAALSTYLDAPSSLSVGQVWHWLAPALLQELREFCQHGFAPLHAAYAHRDALQGQAIDIWPATAGHPSLGEPPSYSGQALGVSEQGALLVHTDKGTQACHSGEVSVRARPS